MKEHMKSNPRLWGKISGFCLVVISLASFARHDLFCFFFSALFACGAFIIVAANVPYPFGRRYKGLWIQHFMFNCMMTVTVFILLVAS